MNKEEFDTDVGGYPLAVYKYKTEPIVCRPAGLCQPGPLVGTDTHVVSSLRTGRGE